MKFARVLAVMLGGLAIGASSAAMAGLNVGVNIGVPAPVYAAPAIVSGWHGDRYWDGRRYWNRADWNRHNGGGHWDHRDRGHGHWR